MSIMEKLYWKDTVFDDRRNQLVIEFLIVNGDGEVALEPHIFWQKSPGDVFEPGIIELGSTYTFNHTFNNEFTVTIEFIFGYVSNQVRPFQVQGEMRVHKPGRKEDWHFMGVFILFNQNITPERVVVKEGSDESVVDPAEQLQPLLPDLAPLNQMDLETGKNFTK